MNWKTEAVDKLKHYEAMRASLVSIPEEIQRLEQAARGIRSATADGTPVRGGGNKREEMLLNNIVCRQELAGSLENAKLWVAAADRALGVLSGDERKILERFYIYPEKGAAERLAGELWMDVKTVYRHKDEALRRFTIALYGGVEQ